MFLHPSELLKYVNQHIVILQEDYDALNKAIDEGLFDDLEKARKEFSKLIPVKTLVTRNGKVYTETVYINPDKTNKEKFVPKYRKSEENTKTYIPEKPESVIIDSNIFKRGDLVKLKLQDGTEVIGQFRHFSITKDSHGKAKAIIRAEIRNRKGEVVTKTIERNPEEIVLLSTPKEGKEKREERLFDPSSFKVGDGVTITIRNKNKNSIGVTTEEKEAVLIRKTAYGFDVMMGDGEVVSRPASTLRKVSESKVELSSDQEIILNKAVKRIKNAINDKIHLISVFEKKKPSNWINDIEKFKKSIQDDKNMQYNYFQVFKGNLHFDDVVTEAPKKIRDDYE